MKFTIYDLRFTSGRQTSAGRPAVARSSERGIALIITLIMLAITLVMAVAFMALARRERGSVDTTTQTTTARLAADTALANAEAQIVANLLLTNGNAFNLGLLVSTNYLSPAFVPGVSSPTNINYWYANGSPLSYQDLEINVANLWYLPRAPVFIQTNTAYNAYDFRYYLDLNENRQFDPNGWQAVTALDPANGLVYYDTNGNPVLPANLSPPNVMSNYFVGDPEWVGVLDHPDMPHSPNNQFISRYAFIAVPVGNTLDLNYIHNQSQNTKLTTSDGYMRNQGVGGWEMNLAAFLADLNTNIWGRAVGSWLSAQPNAATYYEYNEPSGSANTGYAFDDARALLTYRYSNFPLANANNIFFNSGNIFPQDTIDDYSQGPLQTTLDTNEDFLTPRVVTANPWSGADNTNHFFALADFFDLSKTALGLSPATVAANNDFTARLKAADNGIDTYDRYTFYRMLSELGTDSSPDDGKLNLNYANAQVNYTTVNGVSLPVGISVITGMETNLQPWSATNFFHAAANQMLQYYTANWFNANNNAFINTFNVNAPFGITNIPVVVSNRFVYTPAVHRLLQLAANLYDATTNGNNNLPHVFRPVFERVNSYNNDIYIVGYVPVLSVNGANPQADPQLQDPFDITQLSGVTLNAPIINKGVPINVYGVPWIVGAKKSLPSFNQLYMTNAVQVTRNLQFHRPKVGSPPDYTNELFVMSFNTGLGASFWNSYETTYPRPLTVFAKDFLNTTLMASNSANGYTYTWVTNSVFYLNNNGNNTVGVNSWPGTQWYGTVPNAVISNSANCFLTAYWPFNFLNSPVAYQFSPPGFAAISTPNLLPWTDGSTALSPLPQFYLAITNYLQAYILDGDNVIDYVQFRDPNTITNITAAMADPTYPDPNGATTHYQWSTNLTSYGLFYGIYNQYYVSGQPKAAPVNGGQWVLPQNFLPPSMLNNLGANSENAEAAFFNAFFTPNTTGAFSYNGSTYYNSQLQIQAPYTPTRIVFSPFLLQANDPMVHTLSSDLNGQAGATAVWGDISQWPNGIWKHIDDMSSSPLPLAPATPVGGRFQPWGVSLTAPVINGDPSGYNSTYRDSLAWGPDAWDFPTNPYPSVGWIGRVHRGTPWQTVYLKASDVLTNLANFGSAGIGNVGSNEWAAWTGDVQQDYYSKQYIDGARLAPMEDHLLFDLFTTRFNDNSARGRLPVNAGAGLPDGGLAAWSALLSGMVALSNSAANVFGPVTLTYNNLIINPAGIDAVDSPVWQILNNVTNGINVTRANKNLFPSQSFVHPGDILATPALTEQSPFLNWNNAYQQQFGISDEMYEWLPQQMMGLVRASEARYVLYCVGQTLKPAPGGEVVGGPYSQLVTNYQVVAESAVRVVLRVDNATTSQPHVVVESYNVLPPD